MQWDHTRRAPHSAWWTTLATSMPPIEICRGRNNKCLISRPSNACANSSLGAVTYVAYMDDGARRECPCATGIDRTSANLALQKPSEQGRNFVLVRFFVFYRELITWH